jgi:hypothetical protein
MSDDTPNPIAPYHAAVMRYSSESLCQTRPGHPLCRRCARAAPGKRTERHFLVVPAMDAKHCKCFKNREQ